MNQQIKFFFQDIKRMLGKNKIRLIHIWLSRVFWGIFLYRIERSGYLLFGNSYKYIRIIFIPVFNLIQAYSNIDINYRADIGGGFIVLHPSMGVVISGFAVIGNSLSLTGGNVIGIRKECKPGDFKIGDYCSLGANAVILGPVILGNGISVGALACVVKNCNADNATLLGIPAKEYKEVHK